MKEIIVIGGGASGLMAAISAVRNGAKVTILEKNTQPGRKILVTGNGRCNFTNRKMNKDCFYTDDQDSLETILQRFSENDTISFFEELGIRIKDRNGYLYPNSGQASSILDVLLYEASRLKIKLACNINIIDIEKKEDKFLINTEGWKYSCDALIISCGSGAAPATGATTDGYRYSASLGHNVIKPLPALTGLVVSDKDAPSLTGVRCDGLVSLDINDQIVNSDKGEIQFTSYGLSGIPVFQISGAASRALDKGDNVKVHVNLWDELTKEELRNKLKKSENYHENRSGGKILTGIFPDKLNDFILLRSKVDRKRSQTCWNEENYDQVVSQIQDLCFHIKKVKGPEQAQVYTGGVPLGEVDASSMESRICHGLYFSGEILNVDGICGGYNLQWAWSSGYLAGISAAAVR